MGLHPQDMHLDSRLHSHLDESSLHGNLRNYKFRDYDYNNRPLLHCLHNILLVESIFHPHNLGSIRPSDQIGVDHNPVANRSLGRSRTHADQLHVEPRGHHLGNVVVVTSWAKIAFYNHIIST